MNFPPYLSLCRFTLLFVVVFAVSLRADVLRFTAELKGTNEVPANLSTATGRAELVYDPATQIYTAHITVAGLATALTSSHIHEAVAGANGAVVINFGGAAAYTAAAGGFYAGTFTGTYTADLSKLLGGGAYVNIHSTAFAGGEIRGQLVLQPRVQESLLNYSARGLINPGNGRVGTIIGGFVLGTEKKILIRALGESLRDFGVSNHVPDTAIELYNGSNVRIAANDDWKDTQPLAVAATGFTPFRNSESALVRTLAAGSYTAMLDSDKGAGVALLEVYALENVSLLTALQRMGQFTTLIAAVQAAGLDGVLSGPGPFTLFAPTDAAFAKLGSATVQNLLKPENKAQLTALLLKHLTVGTRLAAQLGAGPATSLQGGPLTFTLVGGAKVNGAVITEADIQLSNGVVHAIDTVLQP